MKTRKRLLGVGLVLAAVLMMLVSCAGQATPTAVPPTSAPTPTFIAPTPSHTVDVTKDVEYVNLVPPDAPAQKLDVYAPSEPGPWPVLILNHAWYQSKDAVVYANLAKDLAGRGLVVFVPSRRSDTATLAEGAKDNGRDFREAQESWACAIRFAREHAAEYGGDPDKLTMFSHGTSGLQVALLGDDMQPAWDALAAKRGGPPPQTECLSKEGSAQIKRYVSYAGEFDWYDKLKEMDPELYELTSFLALSPKNPDLRLHLVAGDMAAPDDVELTAEYRETLASTGHDATVTMLPGEGGEFPYSGPNREALIQIILEEARR
jgi:dienelactone hydrolase